MHIFDLEKKIQLLIETNLLHQKKIELLESEIGVLNKSIKKKKKAPKAKNAPTESSRLRSTSATRLHKISEFTSQSTALKSPSHNIYAAGAITPHQERSRIKMKSSLGTQREGSNRSKRSLRSAKSSSSQTLVKQLQPNTCIGRSRERNFDFNKIDNYIETFQPKKKSFPKNSFQP